MALVVVQETQGLCQSPDVVPGESQGFDLRQLVLITGIGKHESQSFQSFIQAMHSIPLSVVRLHSSCLL